MLEKLFGLHKVRSGWMEYLRQFLVLGEYRGGTLIGTDKAGNRYYEITKEKSMFPCKATNLLLPFVIQFYSSKSLCRIRRR